MTNQPNEPVNETVEVPAMYGETVAQFEAALESHKVVMVAKTTCGYCKRAEGLLRTAYHETLVFNIDKAAEGDAIRASAQEMTGCKTVPVIFFNGKFVGGCDDVMGMKSKGTLYQEIGTPPPNSSTWVPASSDEKRDRQLRQSLFYFPHTVNLYVIQAIALQVVVLGLICCVFYERTWAAWLTLGMALDFLIRVIGGGMFSPLGAIAMVVTLPFPEKLGNGVSKQFAASIGLAFTLTAGMCMINGHKIAGCTIMAGLCGAAALEGFLGFCLGCWFFGKMIAAGILSGDVYNVHIDQKPNMEAALAYADDLDVDLRPVKKVAHRQPGQPATLADARFNQNKSEEHVKNAFNIVRYMNLSDFIIPLCFAGLAIVFKLQMRDYYQEKSLWHFFAFVSLGLFIVMTMIMIFKLALYPHKVWSEITHPINQNATVPWPLLLVVYAFLYEPDSEGMARFQKAWFWMGSALLQLLLVYKVSKLIGSRYSEEVITPNTLLPIGGSLLAAATATLWPGYLEVGWFLFGLPAALSMLMLGNLFYHSITYSWSDERMRLAVCLWPAVVHMMFVAYVFLQNTSYGLVKAYGDVSNLDPFAHVLFYSGLTLLLVVWWLAVPMGFLLRLKFDMSFWSMGFLADIVAVACVVFDMHIKPQDDLRLLGEYLVIGSIVLACWVNFCLTFITVFWAAKRRWPRPAYKFAPLAFQKLTHDALRNSSEDLLNAATYYKGMIGKVPEQTLQTFAKDLATELELYLIVVNWHATMEDEVLFRYVDSFQPLMAMDAYRQHHILHQMEHKAEDLVHKLLHEEYPAAEGLTQLQELLEVLVPFSGEHLDWEEANLTTLLKKEMNLEVTKKVMKDIWYKYLSKSMEEVMGKKYEGKCGDWDKVDLTKIGRTFEQCAYPVEMSDADGPLKYGMHKYMSYPSQFPDTPMPVYKQQVMRVLLPWVVNNLKYPMQRSRFLKALAWGTPEMAKQMGDMVYRGVPETTWACIATDVPECVPRGLPGWSRYM
eukprot:TRINITY_DN2510_c1_g1_i1.p1 TRINITY_DN2510_c1_g1~~TRINITY_DN2510_c1_g1_i1.p1  ORF type:complete len:999 (+),score=576.20 TRINITY_DN2510_c1_g1_i1:49-3045(+)